MGLPPAARQSQRLIPGFAARYRARPIAAVILLLAIARPAFPNPADYVYTPSVEYGEREIDVKYGVSPPSPTTPRTQGASLGLGYGAGEHWFTELYLKQERIGRQLANLAEWENKFQLTETGQYPVDAGIITELEIPLSTGAAREVGAGPLLQTELGKFQINCNAIFRRAFGKPDETGVPFVTNLNYQWQVQYRGLSTMNIGLQGLGGMGQWNHWADQSNQGHFAGPAIQGKTRLDGGHRLRYNAAWLFGVSRTAPRNTLRMQMELEF